MKRLPFLELPVVEWARDLARELPVYNTFLLVGVVLVLAVGLVGRHPVVHVLAAAYVLSFFVYVPLRKRLRGLE